MRPQSKDRSSTSSQDQPIALPFGGMTLVELLRYRTQHQPDQPIYTFQGQHAADAHLTIRELDRQARMIGAHLQQMALPGQRVLLLYPPGLDYIAAFFGCLYANLVAVPAYLPPRNRPAPRLHAIVEDAQPALALTTSATLANLRLQFDHMPQLGALRWLTTDELTPNAADAWQPPQITSATLAFLQYTSGSTTAPKGVMLTHGNLLHNLGQIYHYFGHSPESRGVIWLPPYHDMGLIGGILQPLYGGFPVTLMSPVAFLQRPLGWLETIARTRATTSGSPNFAYDLCVRKSTPEQRAALDLSSWTVAFSGAEPVRPSTIERFAEAFACANFRREAFYPCYGLAEATLIVTGVQVAAQPTVRAFDREALTRHQVAAATTSESRELVGCGSPLASFDQQIAIVQPETQRRCAPHEIGEIWVAGPSVAGGYWNRAEETAHAFNAFLAETQEGPFLRTGDLGFVHDGELFVTGRLKELIIIHGRNYYPQDLEITAEQSHIVLQPNGSAAFGVEIGGEERLVIVHEVQRQYRAVSSSEVAAAVRRAVAEDHEVQVYAVVLIKPGSLPRTSSGKIQRQLCRSQFLAGSLAVLGQSTLEATDEADDSASEPSQLHLPPRATLIALDAVECERLVADYLVARIARLLGIPSRIVDREQPPSAFGLDSLAAVEIQHAIETDLGLVVPMTTVLETPSIAALAHTLTTHLRAADGIEQDAVEAAAEPIYPLSYGQRALWFLHQIAPESPVYTIARAVRIRAAVFDASALRAAFQALVDRHPVLRTTFRQHQDRLVQQVQPTIPVAFHEEDSTTWSEATLHARLTEESRRPFDLVHGPLLRVALFRRVPGESLLLLTVHHIVADGWSLTVLLREVEQLYSAAAAGHSSLLNPPTATYADYVRWQADLLAGSRGAALWHYWQQQLCGGSSEPDGLTLPALDLPLDHPRPPAQTYEGATQHFSLNADLVQQLKTLAAPEGATLFMIMLAAFQALLYRYTGQSQIVVGSPTAGRSRARFADTIGYFVNPVVLRADLHPEGTRDLRFSDLLRQTRQTVLEALAHHEYPFPLLVERLSPDRDVSRSPLFQVMFSLEKNPWSGADDAVSGLRMEPIEVEQNTAQFDLALMLLEQGAALDGTLHYNTDLFAPDTIGRMVGHFQTLLAAIVGNPEQRLAELPLLTAVERQQLLVDWNATAAPLPHATCLHQLVEAQVAEDRTRLAVACADRTLSYAELNDRANQLAHALRELGVGPDVPVALFMERSPEFIVGMLAILKAGGAYMPLDPAYPAARVETMLTLSRAPVILTQDALAATLPTHQVHIIRLDAAWPTLAQQPTINPSCLVLPDHLAYIIFTSGSTGQPKGVGVSHRAALNLVGWHQQTYAVTPQDRASLLAGLAFDAAVWEIWPYLASGASLHLPPEEIRAAPDALVAWLQQQAITLCFMPTPLAEAVFAEPSASSLPLRALLTGGDRLHAHDWSKLPYPVINHYGPTENTVVTTAAVAREGAGLPPIGRPIANTQVYLLDWQMQPVPIGVVGEIYIGGVGLARGYFDRPDLTAERFPPNPFSPTPGARLYKTGDLARYQAGGTIDFVGRIDHQVKLRGFRIELGEIETVLKQHPGVRDAVVTLRDDRLVAYVVEQRHPEGTREQRTKESNEPDSCSLFSVLCSSARSALPAYMVPSAFVLLDCLPVTPNGKIDRKALPAPERERPALETPLVVPRSGIERAIAAVWQDVLQVERVGIHDNFFDLGGHSLLVAQVHTRLRETLNLDLPLLDLFRYPTISALATHLVAERDVGVAAQQSLESERQIAAPPGTSEIAIIGMDGRFPGAANLDEFWQNLCGGVEAITFFTDEELLAAGVPPAALRHPNYVKARGILRDIDLFDAEFFGITPREAQITDPQQRLFLECAWNALESAGYDSLRYPGKIGVFAGAGFNTYLLAADRAALESMGRYQALIGNDKDFVPTRVSYKLNLRGPSVNVQTACSTSLVAIHLACQSLASSESDMVLAGGVTIGVPHTAGYFYEPGGLPSPDGHCRAFDATAQGMVFGNGVGVVVLKRLSDALRDGDTIHAVIRGSAINNDGAGKIGYTAPSVEGQAEVIADSLRSAQVDPASISYVEAHGTGTPLGDPIEVAALNTVFRPHIQQTSQIALGSVKTSIGHPDVAAGVAGLIKTVLALQHKLIPPSLNFESPNPQIDFVHSPFYVNTSLRDWTTSGIPRRAGVSSFGIGGTNAHVILEEAPEGETAPSTRPWHLLVLSARSSTALDTVTANLAAYLRQHPECDLGDVAYTLQVGRRVFDHRRMVLARDRADAMTALETCDPQRVRSEVCAATQRPVALLFPGQGAQYVNMGRDLYTSEAVFRETVDHCCDQLMPSLGLDLRAVLYPDDDHADGAIERLIETRLAQPALFVIAYALAQLWISWGIKPSAMIGHSIGEYVAACLAGVFSLEDALKLVAARGRLMQQLPSGAMLSVSLSEQEILPRLNGTLSLAAVNSDRLCVVAGPNDAIATFEADLTSQAIESRRLHTSHAFHSAMIEPILEQFAEEVRGIALHPPQIPYISNVTGSWITAADAQSPMYWTRHLRHTVQFGAGLRTLLAEADWLLLEVGPGHTLSTLARQNSAITSRHAVVASLRRAQDHAADDELLHPVGTRLGRCWLAGVTIDWAAIYGPEHRRRIPLPTYPFERQRYWIATQADAASRPILTGKQPDPADWFAIPFWKPSILTTGTAQTEVPARRWLVFDDGSRLAEQLLRALHQHGGAVTTVTAGTRFDDSQPHAYTLNPQRRADYNCLVESLAARGSLPERIVHLWSMTEGQASGSSGERFAQAQRMGYASLLNLAQALGRQRDHQAHLIVIANRLHSVHADEPIAPEQATILGACTVIPQEYPALSCQTIDVVAPSNVRQAATLAKSLLGELMAAPSTTMIAYRNGQRWTQTFESVLLEATTQPSSRLRDHGIYLIVGGPSPIEQALETYLDRTVQARLVRADAADAASMREVIADVIERFGALHGVFYTAVAIPTKYPIQDFDEAAYLAVFEPQASGAAQVAELLGAQELDFVLIVTANTGLLGGAGLATAAATTRFIEALAHEQQRNGDVPWINLRLDLEQLDSAQSPGLMPEELIEVCHRTLATESASRLIVSTVDLQTRLRQAASGQAARAGNGLVEPATTTRSTTRPYVPPQTDIETALVSIWQRLLGIEQIGVHDDFFELGGHSLLATQIVAQVQERLGMQVSIQQVFESPTIALLAEAIDQHTVIDPAQQQTRDLPIAAAPREMYRMKRAALTRQSQPKSQDQQ